MVIWCTAVAMICSFTQKMTSRKKTYKWNCKRGSNVVVVVFTNASLAVHPKRCLHQVSEQETEFEKREYEACTFLFRTCTTNPRKSRIESSPIAIQIKLSFADTEKNPAPHCKNWSVNFIPKLVWKACHRAHTIFWYNTHTRSSVVWISYQWYEFHTSGMNFIPKRTGMNFIPARVWISYQLVLVWCLYSC